MKNNFFKQFDILVSNYSEKGYFETNFGLNYYRKQLKFKKSVQNSFKSYTISTFNFRFLGSVILHKLCTTACSGQHNFGLERYRHINNISYES